MNETFIDHLDTPLGVMEITASESGVQSVFFVEQVQEVNANKLTELTKQQLRDYFAGERELFDLPLAPQGTDFQQQVWRELIGIAYGETCSYSDIANSINNAKAVRAVGAANGKNPLTIIVPCHRVIGRNGKLTGYAFGVDRKAWLLDHESDSLF